MKKSGKLASHVVNSNIAIGALPTLLLSLGIVTLFEKIYYEVPIIPVFSNIGEHVKNRCFKEVYDVKSANPTLCRYLQTIILIVQYLIRIE
jgi:hypothetical protein